MNNLLSTIDALKHTDTQRKIQRRIQQFKKIDTHSAEELFKELCFCILTANFNSERTIRIHGNLTPVFAQKPKNP